MLIELFVTFCLKISSHIGLFIIQQFFFLIYLKSSTAISYSYICGFQYKRALFVVAIIKYTKVLGKLL